MASGEVQGFVVAGPVGANLQDHVSVSLLYECDAKKLERHRNLNMGHVLKSQPTAPSIKALRDTSPSQLVNTTVINGFFRLPTVSHDARPYNQVQSFFATTPDEPKPDENAE
jgi:hypothetical protein